MEVKGKRRKRRDGSKGEMKYLREKKRREGGKRLKESTEMRKEGRLEMEVKGKKEENKRRNGSKRGN